jgi:flagellin-like protein
MKTLRKIRKNAKALSPVVASIILIAVTVAVSIAVAAWMGALTVSFMDTEQIVFEPATFLTGESGSVSIVAKNTGTSPVTISYVYLNGKSVTLTAPVDGVPFTINANGEETITFAETIVAGDNYQIKVVTSSNNPFVYTAVAPD